MIVVCRFCPNTFDRPPRSHGFTCPVCRRKRRSRWAMRWVLNKPIDERRAYYRERHRKEKLRHLRRRMAGWSCDLSAHDSSIGQCQNPAHRSIASG